MDAHADCVFCRIIAGLLPCSRLLGNDRVLAFLGIDPVTPGHLLVFVGSSETSVNGLVREGRRRERPDPAPRATTPSEMARDMQGSQPRPPAPIAATARR